MIAYIKGIPIQIDECDVDLLETCNWFLNTWGQFQRDKHIGGVKYTKTLHRLIVERKTGIRLRRAQVVSFINGDRRDYRRENLYLEQPNMPRKYAPHRNKTGYKGVTFVRGYYRAIIMKTFPNGVRKALWLGQYKTAEEAHEAVVRGKQKYFPSGLAHDAK